MATLHYVCYKQAYVDEGEIFRHLDSRFHQGLNEDELGKPESEKDGKILLATKPLKIYLNNVYTKSKSYVALVFADMLTMWCIILFQM